MTEKQNDKGIFKSIGIFLAVVAAILLFIIFFWYIMVGLAILACLVLVIVLVILALVAVLFLFAIPYFIISKKTEVQHYASYDLDEIKDKDDMKKQ